MFRDKRAASAPHDTAHIRVDTARTNVAGAGAPLPPWTRQENSAANKGDPPRHYLEVLTAEVDQHASIAIVTHMPTYGRG
ncbi:hypothetical protein GGQ68_003193 [Sagittula marina]|uniref:Uncharacterized protein n=1 Tax=Sagittula marina TaxID=943940 RepID=A0A7W6DX32_9RHOB|nr:hypothetical protein [Sagittula marina]MBB3986849.1 hypothetical protein [Sagittula marina]